MWSSSDKVTILGVVTEQAESTVFELESDDEIETYGHQVECGTLLSNAEVLLR